MSYNKYSLLFCGFKQLKHFLRQWMVSCLLLRLMVKYFLYHHLLKTILDILRLISILYRCSSRACWLVGNKRCPDGKKYFARGISTLIFNFKLGLHAIMVNALYRYNNILLYEDGERAIENCFVFLFEINFHIKKYTFLPMLFSRLYLYNIVNRFIWFYIVFCLAPIFGIICSWWRQRRVALLSEKYFNGEGI